MKCSRCGNDAVIVQEYAGVALCPRHAAADIEAKAKREVRKCGGISSGEKLFVGEGGSAESHALSNLLSVILAGRRDVTFVTDTAFATAVVTADTLDDIAEHLLSLVCLGNTTDLLETPEKKTIRPLSTIPRTEVYFYASHHGWVGGSSAGKTSTFSSDIAAFLKTFSVGHPSAAYALKRIADQLPELYLERHNHAV
ncbi:hypothetical protein [Methanorbis rubei]|uniref:2-thiouridine synthetase TtuA-like N-terminal LIM domain-containing protein n=1 Tax=Methanorbis rubei TaxID=3028300 RepID=A0AAE4MD55_9EURY|nr:hypothetical protein [Methanocorpusculaceae archaeon Cs1]